MTSHMIHWFMRINKTLHLLKNSTIYNIINLLKVIKTHHLDQYFIVTTVRQEQTTKKSGSIYFQDLQAKQVS